MPKPEIKVERRGWLGREDSNLRMAESKSDYFSFDFSAYSEKISKFELLLLNRLALDSECEEPSQPIQLFLVRQRSPLLVSLLGVKRTYLIALHMSAFDPKRTLAVRCGNGFDAGFSPYQSARLSGYDAVS